MVNKKSISYVEEAVKNNKSLRGANLSDANLRGVDLRGVDLSDADLRCADLRCADLSNTDLHYAKLSYANLSNTNLSYANLNGADLRCADLRRADLRGVDLGDANLSGVDLRGAIYGKGIIIGDKVIQISGLRWPILIFKDHIKIGCQFQSREKWKTFSDEDITRMDKESLEDWKKYKEIILSF